MDGWMEMFLNVWLLETIYFSFSDEVPTRVQASASSLEGGPLGNANTS